MLESCDLNNSGEEDSFEKTIEIITLSNFSYDVKNNKKQLKGPVDIYVRSLDDFREGSELWEKLHYDFKNDEKVAEIDVFGPYGEEDSNKEYPKKGLGSYVYNKVLLDLKEKGIRILYCFNPSKSLLFFMKKRDFKELPGNQFFRVY